MNLITLDFETFYSRDYSLKKLTTEEYIRDPRFEVIGVGLKVNDEDTEWASGTQEQLRDYLQSFDWENSALLAHNTRFDGAILNWIFDVRPRIYLDTMCVANARHGVEHSASLAALAEKHKLGAKGTEVTDALNMRRIDFSEAELSRYGDYCVNDVELTYELFQRLSKKFPQKELRLIDLTLRMFIEPVLELDLLLLEQHLEEIRDQKEDLLLKCGVSKEDLMSNPKFAEALQVLGVEPPKKMSLTTGKETFAFAKTDEGFKALLEHEDEKVQILSAARIGNKSTLEETRTQRFIEIAKRGSFPVPLKYYAAHTGRWGGVDKINLQNLPSRGSKKLKDSIIAPEGYSLIDCDSSQIEARVLAWLAGQDDLVESFANREDVYVKMASAIYNVPEEDITKDQRFVGKTTILGCGYGMGADRFKDQLATFGFDIDLHEAKRIIKIYRQTNDKVFNLWRRGQDSLKDMANKTKGAFGIDDILKYLGDPVAAITLPSGVPIRYTDLQAQQTEYGYEYNYASRRGRTKIYGGKLIENVCQALARCIIGEQIIAVSGKYKVVLTVHDSIICCVLDDELQEATQFIESCMRTPPQWANGIPLDCESGKGKTYGACG
jgi:DNA polymerase